MMSIISWIVVGALAGWIASIIMKTNAQMGALENIIAGIVGALVGGWIISLFGVQVEDGAFNVPSILTAILGACLVIAIVKMLRGRRPVAG